MLREVKLKKSFFYLLLGVAVLSSLALAILGTSHFLQSRQWEQALDAKGHFQLEKLKLISKIASLEASLKRIEQSTEKLESAVALETGDLAYGVGPVGATESFEAFLQRLRQSSQPKQDGAQAFSSDLSYKLDDLSIEADALELKVNELYQAQSSRLNFWASSPSLWPVQGWVTSEFGYRYSPWNRRVKMHNGLDIAAPTGTLIKAPSQATVIFSGRKGGYGRTLVLDHGYGIQSVYAHASALLVQEGDQVSRGESIAKVGSSGASTGPHLHYEIHVDGVPVDPMSYIAD